MEDLYYEVEQTLLPQWQPDDLPVEGSYEREQILSWLVPHILNLLEYDFHRLAHIMYRVDIPEQLFQAALNERPLEKAATILANLAIDRELKKMKTRKKYREAANDDEDDE